MNIKIFHQDGNSGPLEIPTAGLSFTAFATVLICIAIDSDVESKGVGFTLFATGLLTLVTGCLWAGATWL